ncbi:alginate lyase family protein [Salinicola halophilus]|uniref:alginate lyase family protein n=1 Tax=Salinicola halophilus TaxID=184065 RepID=UPI0019550179|nr:alginate lyase family protein [Salinicola halophilus]
MHKKLARMLSERLKKRYRMAWRLYEKRNRPTPADRGAPPRPAQVEAPVTERLGEDGVQHDGAGAPRFVLYRIIGNDLEPRHARGQSRANLRFILENEPSLDGCEKRFIVNRIVNSQEHAAIIELLESYGQTYIDIPFVLSTYAATPWDFEGLPSAGFTRSEDFQALSEAERGRVMMRLYRFRNLYVMNNNGARNVALDEGREIADWVLPWDGNCFVTASAWADIRRDITAHADRRYHVVPMARITDNQQLLDDGFAPAAAEEPQIAFRHDAGERFDERHPYGRRPKVELLWRLGVPGRWDRWKIEPWDLECPPYAAEAGQFGTAGWIARLESGQSHLEVGASRGLVDRGVARVEAVTGLLDRLDAQWIASHQTGRAPLFYAEEALGARARLGTDTLLFEQANAALERGPYSVVDKTTLAPSGDPHDYWHPAPYYWPSPILPRWLPFLPRDGVRVPGTVLYAAESDQYDRTRLQRLFDDVTTCALAWARGGDLHYAEHAATLVRVWFITPETRMNPHLNYAQVRQGHNGNRGSKSGIIEMKDLYFLLDAVRLLERAEMFDAEERAALRSWLVTYLAWLRESPQGKAERCSVNNHGTYYDLQVAAIASFLENHALVSTTLRDSRERILEQFDPSGAQPEELKRTTTAHYCCFNLQGWVYLALLAERHGQDIWHFRDAEGRGLERAFEWLLAFEGETWPWRQIDAFDAQRFQPLRAAHDYAYRGAKGGHYPGAIRLFHPHDGIRPWWFLGQEGQSAAGSKQDETSL